MFDRADFSDRHDLYHRYGRGLANMGMEHSTDTAGSDASQRRDMRSKKTNSRDKKNVLLSGDVGATKTVLALYSLNSPGPQMLDSETYVSRDHDGFDSILDTFVDRHPTDVSCASLAVAGPVFNGAATVTNLSWQIDSAALRKRLHIQDVGLLNDVEALAWAVPHADPEKLRTLNPGIEARRGAIAVIAPGTGCGEAYLTWNGERYLAHPSEGGHTDFAPTDSLQIQLLQFLQDSFEHVSVERVCSGSGLSNIYRFLRDGLGRTEEPWLRDAIAGLKDPAPVIGKAAVEGTSPLCVQTLELFASILAAEAGNLAIKILASAGVYVGGGIPPRVLPFLETESFLRTFTSKGRFACLLDEMPLHVVLDDRAVLAGATQRAFELHAAKHP